MSRQETSGSDGFFRRFLRAFAESDAGRYDAIIRQRTFGRSGSVMVQTAATEDAADEDNTPMKQHIPAPPLQRCA